MLKKSSKWEQFWLILFQNWSHFFRFFEFKGFFLGNYMILYNTFDVFETGSFGRRVKWLLYLISGWWPHFICLHKWHSSFGGNELIPYLIILECRPYSIPDNVALYDNINRGPGARAPLIDKDNLFVCHSNQLTRVCIPGLNDQLLKIQKG